MLFIWRVLPLTLLQTVITHVLPTLINFSLCAAHRSRVVSQTVHRRQLFQTLNSSISLKHIVRFKESSFYVLLDVCVCQMVNGGALDLCSHNFSSGSPSQFQCPEHRRCSYKSKRQCFVFNIYETWFLTLMEKNTLRAFEDRVLNRICGAKNKEVAGRQGDIFLW